MRAKVPGIITSSSQPFRRKKPGGRSTKANVRWCGNNITLQNPRSSCPAPRSGLRPGRPRFSVDRHRTAHLARRSAVAELTHSDPGTKETCQPIRGNVRSLGRAEEPDTCSKQRDRPEADTYATNGLLQNRQVKLLLTELSCALLASAAA